MNINVLMGSITFLVWSAFSTWYYVNYIKQFDQASGKEVFVEAEAEKATEELIAADSAVAGAAVADSNATKAIPAPFEISRNFTFQKNATDLTEPLKWEQFRDSVNAVIKDRDVTVSIEGFTCDLGTEEHNLALGERRAQYLSGLIKSSNASLTSIVTKSGGEKEPLLPNTSEDNRALNRRVTITIKSRP